MKRLARFLDGFAQCFVRSAHSGHAKRYVQGLLSDAQAKNMEGLLSRLAEPGDYQSLQHFITHSTWAADRVWERLVEVMPEREGFLLIDDTSIPKQGSSSVGVARQYCGALGKVANCQVVVTSALRTKHATWPLRMELFLPQTWCDDDDRRERASVPEDLQHRTKIEMALTQIDLAIAAGLQIRCVLADAGYGDSTDFRDAIAARKHFYSVGVGKEVNVFTSPPTFKATSRLSRPELARGSSRPISLEKLANASDSADWTRLTWRKGTKGKLQADFLIQRVVPSHGWTRGETHDEVWLICERTIGKDSVRKFYLSNLPPDLSPKELVRITHERWAIEMQYRDLKQEVALDHFEGRSYPGLARHLVLTTLAYSFLLLERRRSRAAALPSLNAVRRGVTEIVVAMLFATGDRFAKMVAEFARDPPQL
jgi:SRSO17 transposase